MSFHQRPERMAKKQATKKKKSRHKKAALFIDEPVVPENALFAMLRPNSSMNSIHLVNHRQDPWKRHKQERIIPLDRNQDGLVL